jgi:hypothetical protein
LEIANPIFYLGGTAKNKTISVRYLCKHLLKTKADYLRLILEDFFTNFTPNSKSSSLTPSFLLIFKLFISAIMSCKLYLYLLFVTIVLSIVSTVFVAVSWADFIIDFRKVFLTLLVIFIAALKVAFMSAVIRLPAIVMGCVVVSSLFF